MWEPLQKQFLTLSLKTSAALLYAGEGRLFILRSLSIFKKENVLKSFDFRMFGGDKRDRTADLLNAIQALSRTIGYAPPDGLGKDLNIPPRQLMRDKLQYSMEGICCQLAISNFDMYPSPWSWRG